MTKKILSRLVIDLIERRTPDNRAVKIRIEAWTPGSKYPFVGKEIAIWSEEKVKKVNKKLKRPRGRPRKR